MAGRSSGYVTDVGYTRSYRPGLNPLRSRLALLRAGLQPPAVRTACELGFGQGVSVVVHAAASPVRWWGNDLLPAHVGYATRLNQSAGAPATLAEATFAEFAARPDLPRFDFIGLHGILSWVSAANRATIAAFVQERLAPGGVVYAAWNALPGWAELLPLRELMAARAARSGAAATPDRIEEALDFAGRLLATAPRGAGPGLPARFARLAAADRRYLAHEYFNRDWQPLPFTAVAALFAGAGLEPAAPVPGPDSLAALHLTPPQQELLASIPDPALREAALEFCTGATLRQYYWAREPRRLAGELLEAAWRAERVCLVSDPATLPDRVTGPAGELRLDGAACQAVIAQLADHRPRPIGELAAALGPAGHDLAAITAVLDMLIALDHVAAAQAPGEAAAVRPRVAGLNALVRGLEPADAPDVLASPVTGGGVALDPRTRDWLRARGAGMPPRDPRATRRLAALEALGVLD